MTRRSAYNARELRLECIKVAAMVCAQQKFPKGSVSQQAKEYYDFITAGEDPDDTKF